MSKIVFVSLFAVFAGAIALLSAPLAIFLLAIPVGLVVHRAWEEYQHDSEYLRRYGPRPGRR